MDIDPEEKVGLRTEPWGSPIEMLERGSGVVHWGKKESQESVMAWEGKVCQMLLNNEQDEE